MTGHMVFTVTVEEHVGGWHVRVDAGDAGNAETRAPDCKLALECAVPFMYAVAAPDPLLEWLGLPSAPDGPPEMGS
jgi:hypothetical protein